MSGLLPSLRLACPRNGGQFSGTCSGGPHHLSCLRRCLHLEHLPFPPCMWGRGGAGPLHPKYLPFPPCGWGEAMRGPCTSYPSGPVLLHASEDGGGSWSAFASPCPGTTRESRDVGVREGASELEGLASAVGSGPRSQDPGATPPGVGRGQSSASVPTRPSQNRMDRSGLPCEGAQGPSEPVEKPGWAVVRARLAGRWLPDVCGSQQCGQLWPLSRTWCWAAVLQPLLGGMPRAWGATGARVCPKVFFTLVTCA